MADRHLEPGDVQAWLDGEAAPLEHARLEAHLRSCQDCRDLASRAAWEVGLIPIAGTEEGAAAPSPGFEDRVLERIRATPRDAVPPLRALPPVPRPAPFSRRLRWVAAAAAVLAAASAGLWFAKGTGTSPDDMPTGGEGSAVASARSGGVLRWSGKHFDRSLAGSAWVAMDAAVPTFAGEILHSPAPSSIHVRLPGGGWLEAGPSSWLAVGAGGHQPLIHVVLDQGFIAEKIDLRIERADGRADAALQDRLRGGGRYRSPDAETDCSRQRNRQGGSSRYCHDLSP